VSLRRTVLSRLKRFDEHRFLGTRDDMVVHDCDDAEALHALQQRVADDDLLRLNQLQTFGPDTLAEARNRGFRPS
jgi:hypothetical protein